MEDFKVLGTTVKGVPYQKNDPANASTFFTEFIQNMPSRSALSPDLWEALFRRAVRSLVLNQAVERAMLNEVCTSLADAALECANLYAIVRGSADQEAQVNNLLKGAVNDIIKDYKRDNNSLNDLIGRIYSNLAYLISK